MMMWMVVFNFWICAQKSDDSAEKSTIFGDFLPMEALLNIFVILAQVKNLTYLKAKTLNYFMKYLNI